MKKAITVLAAVLLCAACATNKPAVRTQTLDKGTVQVYDFGKVKLHAYDTRDAMADSVFLVEKDGNLVIIEQPAFYEGEKELAAYIDTLNAKPQAKVLSYHMSGGAFLPDVPVYTTPQAREYGHHGGGKALIDGFVQAFGAPFDGKISDMDRELPKGESSVAGLTLRVIPTAEAFDVEIPEINSVYTHMLGADTHSIIAGPAHADAMLDTLRQFQRKNYRYILSAHHMPEGQAEVAVKIAYIQDIKELAASSRDAADFKARVKAKYPAYLGENYLDMTAGFFFPSK